MRYRIIFNRTTHEPSYMFKVNDCAMTEAYRYVNGKPVMRFIMPNPIRWEQTRKLLFKGKI